MNCMDELRVKRQQDLLMENGRLPNVLIMSPLKGMRQKEHTRTGEIEINWLQSLSVDSRSA